jgi:hypothetical protein
VRVTELVNQDHDLKGAGTHPGGSEESAAEKRELYVVAVMFPSTSWS